jgi:flavin-dependent dehydrogenase
MDCDVIVVGGGPTGLWLAYELALLRVHVAVLEKFAKPTAFRKPSVCSRERWKCSNTEVF